MLPSVYSIVKPCVVRYGTYCADTPGRRYPYSHILQRVGIRVPPASHSLQLRPWEEGGVWEMVA